MICNGEHKNPFKFGTIVEDEFFTVRVNELEQIKQMLDSENHLVLISPRRFGKSSLVAKALQQIGRPSITIDFMKILNVEDLAAQILRHVFQIHKFEKVKHFLKHFRIVPTLSYNPMTDGMDVSFVPSAGNSSAMQEDTLELLEKESSAKDRLIVVFDEFQEVNSIDKTLAKQLRAIMQRQNGLNYIFTGSQESMMEEIFEKKKSPFFHFGERMNLKKIPYDDFYRYVPTSTSFSSIKRLLKQGYVIKTTCYELEYPFFAEWILWN